MKIPISAILPGVTEELRHKLSPHSARHLLVPVDRVTPQLAGGAVCVTLGDLRPLTPEVLSDIPLKDDCGVNLPLAEVLKNLGPEHYKRRANQKPLTVPEDIGGLFGLKGQKVFISSTPPVKAEPPRSTRAPMAPFQVPLGTGGRPTSAPVASPASRLPGPAPARPASAGPSGAFRPTPAQPVGPSAPVAMPGALGRAGGFQTSPPFKIPMSAPPAAPIHPEPVPAPAPAPQPAAPKPTPTVVGEPLLVSLSQVSQNWPAEVRHDIAGMNLGNARLALPLEEIEQALKSGKVQFQWKRLCQWFDPPVPATPSPAAGEMPLELPLKVIATLFMARYRPAAVQRKSEMAEDIPDLFGKNAKSGPVSAPVGAAPIRPLSPITPVSPLARPTAPQNLPIGASLPGAPRPAAPTAEPEIDLNALLGAPGHRLPVKDIVANAARLPGATGALLAMSDGLLVASAVPSGTKDEVVAAFLPQIFGRMNQYARELSLGGLRAVALTVEGGNWQIIKETNIYFAVLCRPDKAVPLNQLAAIAAEMNKQHQ